MRTLLLGLALVTTALVGCIGDDGSEPLDEQSVPNDALTPTNDVVRFSGNGDVLPLPDEVGDAIAKLTGHAGAEPTLGITSSGAIFVAAYDTIIRSTDDGETWEVVWDLAPMFNSDPMMWVDPLTDRVYNIPMDVILACSSIVWSDDDGDSWTRRPLACGVPPPFDHQKFATGPPTAAAGALMAADLYPNVAILCYGQLAVNECMMSYDGGLTWPITQPIWDPVRGPGPGCATQNGHPTFSADGVIAVPKSWSCDGLYVAISEDSGQTWRVAEGPKIGGDTIDPEVVFTPDGTMYALWQGDDHLASMARSTDLGRTWEGPWTVSPPGVGSTVMAGMAAGDDGRLGMAFIGTRDTTEYPSDAPDKTIWHAFIVTTEDADAETPTFTSHQVTPDDDPVQVGPVWIGGGGEGSRNMLDFIDAVVGPDGQFYVAFTDGCTTGCAGEPDADPDDSRDDQAALAVLNGWKLRTGASEPADDGGASA